MTCPQRPVSLQHKALPLPPASLTSCSRKGPSRLPGPADRRPQRWGEASVRAGESSNGPGGRRWDSSLLLQGLCTWGPAPGLLQYPQRVSPQVLLAGGHLLSQAPAPRHLQEITAALWRLLQVRRLSSPSLAAPSRGLGVHFPAALRGSDATLCSDLLVPQLRPPPLSKAPLVTCFMNPPAGSGPPLVPPRGLPDCEGSWLPFPLLPCGSFCRRSPECPSSLRP